MAGGEMATPSARTNFLSSFMAFDGWGMADDDLQDAKEWLKNEFG
jgi:hypothetical protein